MAALWRSRKGGRNANRLQIEVQRKTEGWDASAAGVTDQVEARSAVWCNHRRRFPTGVLSMRQNPPDGPQYRRNDRKVDNQPNVGRLW